MCPTILTYAAAAGACCSLFLLRRHSQGRKIQIIVVKLYIAIDIVVCDSVHNNHIIKSLECVDACANTLFLILCLPFGDPQ